jgi:sugar phosphate isomerase/epimerase
MAPAKDQAKEEPFLYGLNTSTIREQKLSIVEEVELASREGYQAIEPWISELDQYVKKGGSLKDLGKRIADRGLKVESAIGFAEWIVEDNEQRKKGLEQARRDMDLVRQIGGKRIAAPPSGATKQKDLNLLKAAERYRALLEIGDQIGVIPQVEVWGSSKNLSRLSEAAYVAIAAGHPDACILPDTYHLHRGGSSAESLELLSGVAVHAIHINDYPVNKLREELTDADRVFPGAGDAPLGDALAALERGGFAGALSLEVFNREYWQQDPRLVVERGYQAMRELVGRV